MNNRKKVGIFFLRVFDTNSVPCVYESLTIPKMVLSDVCRNTKTQEQLNGSIDLC